MPQLFKSKSKDDDWVAILISSSVLNDELWITRDRSFDPPDKRAVYLADELPEIAQYTKEHLKIVHACMKAFRGAKILTGSERADAIIAGKEAARQKNQREEKQHDLWSKAREKRKK